VTRFWWLLDSEISLVPGAVVIPPWPLEFASDMYLETMLTREYFFK
jgi:hypothetical protein